MTEHGPAFQPCTSQRQSDMMEHAAHSTEYALSRSVPDAVAQGRHAADIAAGLWGKTATSPCAKCVQAQQATKEGV